MSSASYAVKTRYATALLDLAEEASAVEKVEKDLLDLQKMIAESEDLERVFHAPWVSRSELGKVVQSLAEKAKFQTLTKNFLGVLAQNGRLYAISDVIDAFQKELSKRRGEVHVEVKTAQDLTPAQKKELEAALSKSVGKDVSIQAKVEPSILGGMIVTIGSQMIDDSVARKLERLRAAMNKQSNENTNEQRKEA